MDTAPVVIGSNTRDGKRPKHTNIKVAIYNDGEILAKVPFGPLTRFSKLAAETLSKPENKLIAGGSTTSSHYGSLSSGDAVASPKPDSKPNAGSSAKSSHHGSLSPGDTKKFPKPRSKPNAGGSPMSSHHGSLSSGDADLNLDVKWSEVYIQPSAAAYGFAFGWMAKAATYNRNDLLPDYGFPDPSEVELYALVDCYAATLCLGLRPSPSKHIKTTLDRVSQAAPSFEDVKYITEHLPVDNVVVTRLINMFLNNASNKEAYTLEQRHKIEEYFEWTDDALWEKYDELKSARFRSKANAKSI